MRVDTRCERGRSSCRFPPLNGSISSPETLPLDLNEEILISVLTGDVERTIGGYTPGGRVTGDVSTWRCNFHV